MWEQQILGELEAADIVVMRISRDYIASDYCFKGEMEKALLKFKEEGHIGIPVILR